MHRQHKLYILLTVILVLAGVATGVHAEDNVIVVIIDGARYSETLGDADHTFVPQMAQIAESGTIVEPMLNDSATWTSRAVPALWTGDWAAPEPYNDTQCAVLPTMFEYYRKQKSAPASDCYYVLKYINSLWLPSFHPDYGEDYWPTLHSQGSNDVEVYEEAIQVLQTDAPGLMWLYFADVDHEGHIGEPDDSSGYIHAIQTADSLVGALWDFIQSDDHYRNTTALIVTNDHGRHYYDYTGHGDRCSGCRQIMFLGIGPSFKEGFVSTQERTIPDIAVTAAHLLGVTMPLSSGKVMSELLNETSIPEAELASGLPRISLLQASPNPFNGRVNIRFALNHDGPLNLSVFDLLGRRVATLASGRYAPGEHRATWNSGHLASGSYLLLLESGNERLTRKLLLVK